MNINKDMRFPIHSACQNDPQGISLKLENVQKGVGVYKKINK